MSKIEKYIANNFQLSMVLTKTREKEIIFSINNFQYSVTLPIDFKSKWFDAERLTLQKENDQAHYIFFGESSLIKALKREKRKLESKN